jgi:DtxR family transcriptional regulator, Mn-dependent transcriptional regulator
MESSIVEEYLEAVYKLQAEGKKLGSTELSRELKVSPASATEMMTRLAEKGLVEKTAEAGITLTETGRHGALQVIRKHRISERFLVDVLGMDWKDVHEEACRLEHALSPEVATRMEAMMDNPATCPHGHPIPDEQGRTTGPRLRRLSSLERHQHATVAMIAEEKRDLLEYLAGLGMVPENDVVVEQVSPFNGPLMVKINGARHALGREIAEKIWVQEG